MWAYLPEKRISAKDALNHPFFDEIREDKKDHKTVKK